MKRSKASVPCGQMESVRLCLFDIFCTPHLFASDVF
jgi:hypothetical protein